MFSALLGLAGAVPSSMAVNEYQSSLILASRTKFVQTALNSERKSFYWRQHWVADILRQLLMDDNGGECVVQFF
jgi:hypothetical protein